MAKYTVRKGRRYRATIRLGWAEQVASNEMIANRLRQAGFAEVRVTGSGRTRYAEALWPKDDATAEVPSQVVAIEEVGVPVAGVTRFVVVAKRKASARAKRKAAGARKKTTRKTAGALKTTTRKNKKKIRR
jgi:hypothetical protein